MANNRLWLRCTCGDRYLIAKSMARGYYRPATDSEERFNTWFDEHNACSSDWSACCTPTHYHLEYEQLADGGERERWVAARMEAIGQGCPHGGTPYDYGGCADCLRDAWEAGRRVGLAETETADA